MVAIVGLLVRRGATSTNIFKTKPKAQIPWDLIPPVPLLPASPSVKLSTSTSHAAPLLVLWKDFHWNVRSKETHCQEARKEPEQNDLKHEGAGRIRCI